jgi:hypothetical protein
MSKPSALRHAEVRQAMPAFIRGKLSSSRQRLMQQHISICGHCGAVYRQELQLSEALVADPPALEPLLTAQQRQRQKQQLLRELATLAIPLDAEAMATTGIPEELNQRAGAASRPYPGAPLSSGLAVLASVLAALAVGLLLIAEDPQSRVSPAAVYETRSSAPPITVATAEGQTYRLVVDPAMTATRAQSLLEAAGAVVIEGPSDRGVYTITLPREGASAATSLARLRRDDAVLLVEPSVHTDR